MIKAVVFDLDNTLLDFMKMKDTAVRAAVSSMVFNGLDINKDDAISKIYKIYDNKGYEYQEVFDVRLERRDRMAPNNFMGKPLALEVVSIEQDAHKNPLAKVNHYSRVKKIVSLLEDELA